MSAAADTLARWQDVGLLTEVPARGARTVQLAGKQIAVFRSADDTVFALDDACPHQGGPLSQGIVSGCKVYCPLHNWCIALDSGEAVAPDEGHTGTYPVRVEAGRILIQAEAD